MTQARPLKISGAFDIECAGWSRFVVGCTYDGHRPVLHRHIGEMVEWMRARGGTWWGHAAGVYDVEPERHD